MAKMVKAKGAAKKVIKPKAKMAKVAIKPKKMSAISEKLTKAQIVKLVAEDAGLSSTQVKLVFIQLQNLLQRSVAKQGSGEFVIPELGVKVRRIKKKATKKRMGRNPFTGEEIVIAAKPAREAIKVIPMKALKELVK